MAAFVGEVLNHDALGDDSLVAPHVNAIYMLCHARTSLLMPLALHLSPSTGGGVGARVAVVGSR